MAAKQMLEKFLRKWRKKRDVDGSRNKNGGVQAVDQVCHFSCGEFSRWLIRQLDR
jgi:hypothetical protein